MNRIRVATACLCLCLFAIETAPAADPAAEPSIEWKTAGPEFTVETVQPQAGWVDARGVTAENWKPTEQPDLAAQLEAAPLLTLVDVAPPPQRCWVGHRPYLVPNPGGASWDMVFPYYNTYGGAQEMVIHDFGTGATRKQVLSTGEGDSVLTRARIDFHMQPSFYTDNELVFEIYGPVCFVVYDPAVDAFVRGEKPFGDEVVNGRCVLGEDGLIYGIGWPKDKSGFVAYRFDPKTYQTKRYDTFGPPNEHRRELYRRVVKCGDWLYAAVGAQPWHLVAFDFRSGEGRVLAATESIIGDSATIGLSRLKGGVSGYIRSAATVEGVTDFNREEFKFWLHDGKIVARRGDVPPWSDRSAEEDRERRFDWAREYQQWPRGFVPPSPPPVIPRDRGAPNPAGEVKLPYRLGEQEEQTLRYRVTMYPGEVRLLTEVNDHVLFATDSGYGEQVFYDLKTGMLRRVGGTLSPYSMALFRDRLYVSGYPGSQIIEYDFARPLGLDQPSPNPKRLGTPASDTHVPLGGTVGGADGRVYNAGTTVERRRIGGGLGWYDTQTGELGGLPLADHRIFWMSTACEARYVVLSSKCEGQGKLFVWDTRTQAFCRQLDPPAGATRPGPIAEALPGLVLGHTVDGQQKPLLYGFDPATGRVLWTKPVPRPPVTAFAQVRRQAYSFRRGPDGYIWSFFDNALVRIDPRNANVQVVGRLPDNERPAQLAFAQHHAYFAGGKRLRRIEPPKPPGGADPSVRTDRVLRLRRRTFLLDLSRKGP